MMKNSDLRRNPRRAEIVPWIRHSRCGHVYRACEAQDCHVAGCCLCVEETGTDALWVWWIDIFEPKTTFLGFFIYILRDPFFYFGWFTWASWRGGFQFCLDGFLSSPPTLAIPIYVCAIVGKKDADKGEGLGSTNYTRWLRFGKLGFGVAKGEGGGVG